LLRISLSAFTTAGRGSFGETTFRLGSAGARSMSKTSAVEPVEIGSCSFRQKGSHVRLECTGRSTVTVPLHGEIDCGTLRSVIRTAG
jgi:predicted RNA binding protein YcfA (HicA-like mRNA interferase family)